MIRRCLSVAASFALFAVAPVANAASSTNVSALVDIARDIEARLASQRGAVYGSLLESDRSVGAANLDRQVQIIFVDDRGMPRYYETDNTDAAESISTDRVHPGGGAGYTLDGSTTTLGELGIWDGGATRASHQEFGGRATQMDSPSGNSNHATHVAGTMIAGGAQSAALGMSYSAQLACYDWNSDSSEMANAAANGLLISNHSYGYTTGWRYNSGDGNWYWYGDTGISSTEDYGFGFYDGNAADWDDIAYNAPNYLIVASAGNDRNDDPGPGTQHYYWNGGWTLSTATREADGGSDGFDSIAWLKNAKNIMVVGAVEDVNGGYGGPGSVTMSSFSGWGPSDDGRIRPDLVANGVGLYSSGAGSNSSYLTYSGTSMASPNASGSANLVSEHYQATHGGAVMRSATLKGVLLNTTDECGASDGPDYSHGYGLMNTEAAVDLVQADADAVAGEFHILEDTLNDGETKTFYLNLASSADLRLTVSWTDPAGSPVSAQLNPADLMLVNDLDVRVNEGVTDHEPWILDPSSPGSAATTGDNFRDNNEQIEVASLSAGLHTITITHKGSLQSGAQDFSLVSSLPVSTSGGPTSVAELGQQAALSPSMSPNPFSVVTSVSFALTRDEEATVEVFDVAGRLVALIFEGRLEVGSHRFDWDGRDVKGAAVPAGVYFTRVTTSQQSETTKVVRVQR